MGKSALLLSGGMDSLSIAWWKRPEHAFTVDYGQLSASTEVSISKKICEELNIEHHVIRLDLTDISSGDLVGKDSSDIAPSTDWLPFRNQILVTICAMQAISLGVKQLMLGSVKSDSYHIDGSLEFINQMDTLLKIQEGSLSLQAPAIDMTTIELIRHCGVPLSFLRWAHSCHKAPIACRNCRGCSKYFQIWNEISGERDE